jgi:hypothetical protein
MERYRLSEFHALMLPVVMSEQLVPGSFLGHHRQGVSSYLREIRQCRSISGCER